MIQPLTIVWHETLDSTNEEAKRRAGASSFTPCWIAAQAQSAGRGRLGRAWSSPRGNLFASALFPVPGGIVDAMRLPFAAALAARDAAIALAPEADIRLKWPNDLRVDGAKLSGILVESGQTEGAHWAVVGIGMNVQTAPDADQASTCLADLQPIVPPTPELVLQALSEAFAKRQHQAWTDFAGTRQDWCAHAEGKDGKVRAKVGDTVIEGEFDGLDTDGGLMLRLHNGQRQTIRAGDVELVREV